MADKLGIYNDALNHIGERSLSSLSDSREARRVLDGQWDDTVAYCLEQGLWRFAKRVVQIDASSTITPSFGFNYAFRIPNDWIRTVVLSTSPQLDPPLLQYYEETGYWYANATPLFISYISNDPLFGMNLGAWPQTFQHYVTMRLAHHIALRLTGKADLADSLEKEEDKERRRAKANDAMNDPPGLPPVPYLVRARRGAFGPGGLWFGSGGTGGNG